MGSAQVGDVLSGHTTCPVGFSYCLKHLDPGRDAQPVERLPDVAEHGEYR